GDGIVIGHAPGAGRDLVGGREAFIGPRVAARRLRRGRGRGLGLGRWRLIEREHRILERGFDCRKGKGRRIRPGIGGFGRHAFQLLASVLVYFRRRCCPPRSTPDTRARRNRAEWTETRIRPSSNHRRRTLVTHLYRHKGAGAEIFIKRSLMASASPVWPISPFCEQLRLF